MSEDSEDDVPMGKLHLYKEEKLAVAGNEMIKESNDQPMKRDYYDFSDSEDSEDGDGGGVVIAPPPPVIIPKNQK